MSMAVFLNLSHEQEQSEQQEPRRRNSNLKEVRQTLVVAGSFGLCLLLEEFNCF